MADPDEKIDELELMIQDKAILRFYEEVMEKFHIVCLTEPMELKDHITVVYKTLNYSTHECDATFQVGQSLKLIQEIGAKLLNIPLGLRQGSLPYDKEEWFISG